MTRVWGWRAPLHENYAVLWERIAQRRPTDVAVREGVRSLAYGEFDRQARAVAGALRARGASAGDRVAFFLHNTAEYLVGFYARLKLEAKPVSINYRYRAGEVAELLAAASPAVLVFSAANRQEALDAAGRLGADTRPRVLVETGSGADGAAGPSVTSGASAEAARPGDLGRDATGGADVVSFGDLLDAAPASLPDPGGEAELYIFTGGTTGTPKAVVWGIGSLLDIQQSSIYPPVGLQLPADLEAAVAVPILDALEERAQGAAVVLDSVISSGMRFSDDTKRRLHRLGRVAIVDILASTEGGPYAMAITRHEDELPARFWLAEGSVVLDDGQHEVQDHPGVTGILAFRGSLPKGYLDDPAKTAKTAQAYPVINGVRHVSPGDYVRVQEDRYIDLLGRGGSVVNTGGEKVYPAEVEEVLMGHPSVTDAVVFGLPDERWGEKVAAVVALEPGSTLAEADLLAFVGERLAGYKKPRRLELRDRLERSPTGKLDMAALRKSLNA